MWIVYFSQSCQVEEQFENKFKSKIDIDFDGTIGHFLGINFKCTWSKDGKAQVHLSQPAFIENLLHEENLDGPAVTPANTLYKSSLPVDKIPALTLAPSDQAPLTKKMLNTFYIIGCAPSAYLEEYKKEDLYTQYKNNGKETMDRAELLKMYKEDFDFDKLTSGKSKY